MASLESSYQHAINREPNGGDDEEEEGDDDGWRMGEPSKKTIRRTTTGGQQTETSVLKTYKAWLPGALRKGIVRDSIIDANHMIHYLKYAATRCLFTKQGREKESDEHLSAVAGFTSVLPSNPQEYCDDAGRIRRRQQDSDPSLVQSRPASNLRCQDYIKSVMVEARRLRIQCANFDVTKGTLLEYELRLEQFTEVTTAIFNMDQEKQPTYNFVMPHCDPLRCAVHLMFGRAVDKPMSGNGLSKMYKVFLDATSVSSNKKAHLARQAVPTIMEDMGVSADHIDAVGHWVGNAVTALAGFYVGETYRVPWAEVSVPGTLTKRVFPFVEETLAALRAGGCRNQGTINFLELLLELWPFFWRSVDANFFMCSVMAAIHAQFPKSGIIKRIEVVHNLEAQQFFSQWPDVVHTADEICDADVQLSTTFHEAETRNAFLALSARLKHMESVTSASQEHLVKDQHLSATAHIPHPPTHFIPHGSFPISASQHTCAVCIITFSITGQMPVLGEGAATCSLIGSAATSFVAWLCTKESGDYPDIKSLWQAWEEGMFVEGVGCTPPLRLIDEKWGSCPGQRTRWRPQRDQLARTKWAKFHFFITRISAHKAAGHTIDQTLAFFESERGVRTGLLGP
ncbi:hypothetical protein EI94DRAFT_1700470 [Lactarius quietus]|nr:hypothetical protein EI94DRAFT_1700470 [Lactarius quietus]